MEHGAGHVSRRARRRGRRGARAASRSSTKATFGDATQPAARQRALGRAGVDARDDGHDPEPRPQRRRPSRRSRRSRATRASRGTATAGSSRCTARSCSASSRASEHDEPPFDKILDDVKRKHRANRDQDLDRGRAARGRRARSRPKILRGHRRRAFPDDVRDAAVGRDRRRVPVVEQPARRRLPQDARHPGVDGHRGQRPGDGVRQPRRRLRDRRRVHAQPGDRRPPSSTASS